MDVEPAVVDYCAPGSADGLIFFEDFVEIDGCRHLWHRHRVLTCRSQAVCGVFVVPPVSDYRSLFAVLREYGVGHAELLPVQQQLNLLE